MDITKQEGDFIRALHKRIEKITGGKTPPKNLITSVVDSCSIWNFPVMFEDSDPTEIAQITKSLLNKGLIKEFTDSKGMPSFVPVSQLTIVEYTYREFTQSDVNKTL